MTWRAQAVCDRCFALLNPGRTPTRLVKPEEEICAACGEKTKSGIYIRAEDEKVPYPRKKR